MDLKETEEEFKIRSEENEYILDLMKYCYNLYDHSKNKNYSLIEKRAAIKAKAGEKYKQ